ncbi:NAD(+)--rifampin ADP-ribosyltransferase [Isoalcanivorax beigongshangi]|uniref:NAD(+)--rifampin ADP-ribosyltransferase n=1 Tax=Isoalcanivorax beigongshangi TaxID=3238810 RepID=A0ABV4AIQ9_9GAMM
MTTDWAAVTSENCGAIAGPFYHGSWAHLAVGALLVPGYPSHFDGGRGLRHVYFSALLESAVWGAELAVALTGNSGPGWVYRVRPTAPFEDDPNLTNKRFPGNPTRSYRTPGALRVEAVVVGWTPHSVAEVARMVASIRDRQRQGIAVIED